MSMGFIDTGRNGMNVHIGDNRGYRDAARRLFEDPALRELMGVSIDEKTGAILGKDVRLGKEVQVDVGAVILGRTEIDSGNVASGAVIIDSRIHRLHAATGSLVAAVEEKGEDVLEASKDEIVCDVRLKTGKRRVRTGFEDDPKAKWDESLDDTQVSFGKMFSDIDRDAIQRFLSAPVMPAHESQNAGAARSEVRTAEALEPQKTATRDRLGTLSARLRQKKITVTTEMVVPRMIAPGQRETQSEANFEEQKALFAGFQAAGWTDGASVIDPPEFSFRTADIAAMTRGDREIREGVPPYRKWFQGFLKGLGRWIERQAQKPEDQGFAPARWITFLCRLMTSLWAEVHKFERITRMEIPPGSIAPVALQLYSRAAIRETVLSLTNEQKASVLFVVAGGHWFRKVLRLMGLEGLLPLDTAAVLRMIRDMREKGEIPKEILLAASVNPYEKGWFEKLESKLAAGATVIFLQPLIVREPMERAFRKIQQSGLLKKYPQAQFKIGITPVKSLNNLNFWFAMTGILAPQRIEGAPEEIERIKQWSGEKQKLTFERAAWLKDRMKAAVKLMRDYPGVATGIHLMVTSTADRKKIPEWLEEAGLTPQERLDTDARSEVRESGKTQEIDVAVDLPTMPLNGHLNDPPRYLYSQIKQAVKDFLTDNNGENAKLLARQVFSGAENIYDIQAIRLKTFQEGTFYYVLRGTIRLRDGREGNFVLMVPQQTGTSNEMIAADWKNLSELHAAHPGVFPKPLAFGAVPLRKNSADKTGAPEGSINFLFTEWLGDYIELVTDYHKFHAFEVNPPGRWREWVSYFKLARNDRTRSAVLQRVAELMTEVMSLDPRTGKVSFVREIMPGAGDFMIKPIGHGQFDLKWITVRGISEDRDPVDFLEFLFRGKLFYYGTGEGALKAGDVMEGLRRGLVRKLGEQKGREVFRRWLEAYEPLLARQSETLKRIRNQQKLGLEARNLWGLRDYKAWLKKKIGEESQYHHNERFNRWEIDGIRYFLNEKESQLSQEVGLSHFKDFIVSELRGTDGTRGVVEEALRALAENEKVRTPEDHADLYFIDSPAWNFDNGSDFDVSKRGQVRIWLGGEPEQSDEIRAALVSRGYAAENIQRFRDPGEMEKNLTAGESPHVVIFRTEKPSWEDAGWKRFVYSPIKGPLISVGLDAAGTPVDLDTIFKEIEEKLGRLDGLGLSRAERYKDKIVMREILDRWKQGGLAARSEMREQEETTAVNAMVEEMIAAMPSELGKLFRNDSWPADRKKFGVGENREIVRTVLSRIVNETLAEYLRGTIAPVLYDVSAGQGWLGSMLDPRWRRDGRYVAFDINPNFLESVKRRGLATETVLGNVYQLSEHIQSADVLISADAYDTFEELEKAMAESFAALKPGGKLILFQTLRVGPHPFFSGSFAAEFKKTGYVFCPQLDAYFRNMDNLRQVLRSYVRAAIRGTGGASYMKAAEKTGLEYAQLRSNYEVPINTEIFLPRMKSAMVAAGFKVLKAGKVEASVVVPRELRHDQIIRQAMHLQETGHVNVFDYRHGTTQMSQSSGIPPGQVFEHAEILTFVAEKPSSTTRSTSEENRRSEVRLNSVDSSTTQPASKGRRRAELREGKFVWRQENIVPALTFFKKDGAKVVVDTAAMKKYFELLKTLEVHTILAVGATGEFHKMDRDQRLQAIQILTREAKQAGLRVLTNVTGSSSAETLENVQAAAEAGADGLVVAPLFYLKDPAQVEPEIEAIHKSLHDALPISLYNNPALSNGRNLAAGIVGNLWRRGFIEAIKDSSGDLDILGGYLAARTDPEKQFVYQGSEMNAAKALALGARGLVGSSGNATVLLQRMGGSTPEEREALQAQVNRMVPSLTVNFQKIPPALKWVLRNFFKQQDVLGTMMADGNMAESLLTSQEIEQLPLDQLSKQNARSEARFVSLEIGPGGSLSPWLSDKNIEAYKDAHIIRVDLNSGTESREERDRLNKEVDGFGGSGTLSRAKQRDDERLEALGGKFIGQIDYVVADARKLLMEDESVDEVYMANVVGAPGLGQSSREILLQEARRVLKRGGELIIAETYTPSVALRVSRESSRETFRTALSKFAASIVPAGFEIKTIEFPEYSREAADADGKGEAYEKFLSRFPYGGRIRADDFVPLAPDDYKFVVVVTKQNRGGDRSAGAFESARSAPSSQRSEARSSAGDEPSAVSRIFSGKVEADSHEREMIRILESLKLSPGTKVLIVGPGGDVGLVGYALLSDLDVTVVQPDEYQVKAGYDRHKRMVETFQLSLKYLEKKVGRSFKPYRLIASPIQDAGLEAFKYDVVILPNVLDGVPADEANTIAKEAVRSLAPQGLLVFSAYNESALEWVQPLLEFVVEVRHWGDIKETMADGNVRAMRVHDLHLSAEDQMKAYALKRKGQDGSSAAPAVRSEIRDTRSATFLRAIGPVGPEAEVDKGPAVAAKPMTKALYAFLGLKFSDLVKTIGGDTPDWEIFRKPFYNYLEQLFTSQKPTRRQAEDSFAAIGELAQKIEAKDREFTGRFTTFLKDYAAAEGSKAQTEILRRDRDIFRGLKAEAFQRFRSRVGSLLTGDRPIKSGGSKRERLNAFAKGAGQAESFSRNFTDALYFYWVMANLAAGKNWKKPALKNEPGYFHAPKLVYPFLEGPRVVNDLDLSPERPFLVLVGANASGKSTLLKAAALYAVMARLGMYVPSEFETSWYEEIVIRKPAEEQPIPARTGTLIILDEAFPNEGDFLRESKAAIQRGQAVMVATHHHEAVDLLLGDETLSGRIRAEKLLTTVDPDEKLKFHYSTVPYTPGDTDVRDHSILEARRELGMSFGDAFDAARRFLKEGVLGPLESIRDFRQTGRDEDESDFYRLLHERHLIDNRYFAFDAALPGKGEYIEPRKAILFGGTGYLVAERYAGLEVTDLVKKVRLLLEKMNARQLGELHQKIRGYVALLKNEEYFSDPYAFMNDRGARGDLQNGPAIVKAVQEIHNFQSRLGVNIYSKSFEAFWAKTRKEDPREIKEYTGNTMRYLDIVTGVALAVAEQNLTLPQKGAEADVLTIEGAALSPEEKGAASGTADMRFRFGETNVVTAGSEKELRAALKTAELVLACVRHGFFVPAKHVKFGSEFVFASRAPLFLDSINDHLSFFHGESFFQALLELLNGRVLQEMRSGGRIVAVVDGLYGSNRTLIDILNTALAFFAKLLGVTLIIGTYQTAWAERLKEKTDIPLNIQRIQSVPTPAARSEAREDRPVSAASADDLMMRILANGFSQVVTELFGDDLFLYALNVHQTVNPEGKPLTAISGGAGADISGALVMLGATKNIFVSDYAELDVADLQWVAENLKVLKKQGNKALLSLGDPEQISRYLHAKRYLGGAHSVDTEVKEYLRMSLLLELNALKIFDISADGVLGVPRIRFDWDYFGLQPKQEHSILFVNADITDPYGYPEILKKNIRQGFDVFLLKRGYKIAESYKTEGPQNFIRALYAGMPAGAWFVTDDHYVSHEVPSSSGRVSGKPQGDASADFPLRQDQYVEIDLPQNNELKQLLVEQRYGKMLRFRKVEKPAGPMEADAGMNRAEALSQRSEIRSTAGEEAIDTSEVEQGQVGGGEVFPLRLRSNGRLTGPGSEEEIEKIPAAVKALYEKKGPEGLKWGAIITDETRETKNILTGIFGREMTGLTFYELVRQASKDQGGWYALLKAEGLDVKDARLRTVQPEEEKQKISQVIKAIFEKKGLGGLKASALMADETPESKDILKKIYGYELLPARFYNNAHQVFRKQGGWDGALEFAGLDPNEIREVFYWSDEEIKKIPDVIKALAAAGVDLHARIIIKDRTQKTTDILQKVFGHRRTGATLYKKACRVFRNQGGWDGVLRSAGLNLSDINRKVPSGTPEAIRSEVREEDSSLSIPKTYFGRNGYSLVYAVRRAIENLGPQEELNILTVGSSSGQEGYDVAMAVADHAEKTSRKFKTRITITDIDPRLVEIARRGVYGTETARNPLRERGGNDLDAEDSAAKFQKFFRPVDGTTSRILDPEEFAKRWNIQFSFQPVDVLDAEGMAALAGSQKFDLIIAKNVHYEKPGGEDSHQKEFLFLKNLAQDLRSGGFVQVSYGLTPAKFEDRGIMDALNRLLTREDILSHLDQSPQLFMKPFISADLDALAGKLVRALVASVERSAGRSGVPEMSQENDTVLEMIVNDLKTRFDSMGLFLPALIYLFSDKSDSGAFIRYWMRTWTTDPDNYRYWLSYILKRLPSVLTPKAHAEIAPQIQAEINALAERYGNSASRSESRLPFLEGSIFDAEFIRRERAISAVTPTVVFDLDLTLGNGDALRPGIMEELAKLKARGIRMVVWTMNDREAVEEMLGGNVAAMASYFDHIITSQNFQVAYTRERCDLTETTKKELAAAYRNGAGLDEASLEKVYRFYRKILYRKDIALLGYSLLVDDETEAVFREVGEYSPIGPFNFYQIAPYYPPEFTWMPQEPSLGLADRILERLAAIKLPSSDPDSHKSSELRSEVRSLESDPTVIPEELREKERTIARLEQLFLKPQLNEEDRAFINKLSDFFVMRPIYFVTADTRLKEVGERLNLLLLLTRNFDEAAFSRAMTADEEQRYLEIGAHIHEEDFEHRSNHVQRPYVEVKDFKTTNPQEDGEARQLISAGKDTHDAIELIREYSSSRRSRIYTSARVSAYIVRLLKKYLTELIPLNKRYLEFLKKCGFPWIREVYLDNYDTTWLFNLLNEWGEKGLPDLERYVKANDLRIYLQNRIKEIGIESLDQIDEQTQCDSFNMEPISLSRLDVLTLIDNLIGNAVEAKRKDVALSLSMRFGVMVQNDQKFLRFSLSDNGVGMDPSTLERVKRGESFTTKKRGSGHGIPIIFDIIRRVGGAIEVSSELDKGTTFTLSIPIKTATDPEPSDKSARSEVRETTWVARDPATGAEKGIVYETPVLPRGPKDLDKAWRDFHKTVFDFPKLLEYAVRKKLPVVLVIPEELNGFGPLAEEAPWIEGARTAMAWASAYYRFKGLGNVDIRVLQLPRQGVSRERIAEAVKILAGKKIKERTGTPEERMAARIFPWVKVFGGRQNVASKDLLLERRAMEDFVSIEKDAVKPVTIRPELPPLPKGKQRILVIGGAGFIGTNLVKRFLTEGHQVIVVDSMVSANPYFEDLFRGETDLYLAKFDASRPFDVEGPIDQVLHLGSLASPVDYYGKPLETLRAGLLATREALELARRKHARFLFTSTSEVYGDPKVHPQPETYAGSVNPLGKRSQYDQSKRGAETLIKLYNEKYAAEGLDLRMVRIFNTYGPYMRIDDGRVVTNFIGKLFANEPIEIYGDERITRSFGYVDDTLNGILKLLRTEALAPETPITERVFNIGNDGEFTLRELADLANALGEKYLQRTVPIKVVPVKDPTDPNRRRPDLTRARKILGYAPRVPLQSGFEQTFLYFLHHPEMLKGFVQRSEVRDEKFWKTEGLLRGVTVLRGGKIGENFSDEKEVLALVDEHGKVTGEGVSKKVAHQKGLWHMTAHIYFFDAQGRLLLQKRSMKKSSSPGKLQVSVSGHVNLGEKPAVAAIREGEEEAGIIVNPRRLYRVSGINQIKRSYSSDGEENNEFTTVYAYFLTPAESEALQANFNLEESDEFWVMSIRAFEEKIWEYPEAFSRSLHYMASQGRDILNRIEMLAAKEHSNPRSEVRREASKNMSRGNFVELLARAFAATSVMGIAACCVKQKPDGDGNADGNVLFESGDWQLLGASDTGLGARTITTSRGGFTEIKITYNGDQLFSVKGNGYIRGALPASYRGPNGEKVDWGTSFVLPGYWSGGVYHHNPRITQAEFREGPDGTIIMDGVMEDEAGAWEARDFRMIFKQPLPESVEAEVSFTQKAKKSFSVDALRAQNHEGWKVLQFSSMNVGTAHDSDFVVQQFKNGETVSSPIAGGDHFIIAEPRPLDGSPVYLADQEPSSWGYRPTTFIQMLPDVSAGDFPVQGWISRSSNPNDDNVGAWVHFDGVKTDAYQPGETIVGVHAILGTTRPGLPLVAPSRSEVRSRSTDGFVGRSEIREARSASSKVAPLYTSEVVRGKRRSEIRDDAASSSGPLAVRLTGRGQEVSVLREDGGYHLDDFVGEESKTHAVLYQGAAAKALLEKTRVFERETQVIVPAGAAATVTTEGESFTLSEPGVIGMSHGAAASVLVDRGDVVVITVDKSPAWYKWNKEDSGKNKSGKAWQKGDAVVYRHRDRKNWYDLKNGGEDATVWMTDSTTQEFPGSYFPPIVGVSRVEYLQHEGVFSFHDLRAAESLHEHPVMNGNWELVETYMVTKGAAVLVYFVKDAEGRYHPELVTLRPGDVAFVQPGTVHDLLAVEGPYEHVVLFTPSVHQYDYSFKRQVSDEEVGMDRTALVEKAMNLLRSELRETRSAASEADEVKPRSEVRKVAAPIVRAVPAENQNKEALAPASSEAVILKNVERSEVRTDVMKSGVGLKLQEPAVIVVEKKRLDALSRTAMRQLMAFAAINKEQLHLVVPDLLEGPESPYLADLKELGVRVTLDLPAVARNPKTAVIGLSDKDQDTAEAFKGRLNPRVAAGVKDYFALEGGEGVFLALLVAQPEDLSLKNGFRYDKTGRYQSALRSFFQKLMTDYVVISKVIAAAA